MNPPKKWAANPPEVLNSANLEGKVALISGGARRIGSVIVRTLHNHGMNIVLHCRNSVEEGHRLKDELNLIRESSIQVFQFDLLENDSPEQLVRMTIEQFGRLDVLVNNASVFYGSTVESVTDTQINELFGIHFKAPFNLIQQSLIHLRKTKGCIVNLTDMYAQYSLPKYSVYCASKAALESLTRSLALELAPDIRVNAIAPGAILWAESSTEQEAIIARTPLQRRGRTEEIANAVVYLVRDATFTTGQILAIDGGRSLSER